MPIMTISRTYRFSAAHRLEHHEGLCKVLHGHNYTVVVSVNGELQTTGPSKGMVMDFAALDRAVKPIVEILDHSYLNENTRFVAGLPKGMDDSPTAELVAWYIGEYLRTRFKDRVRVEVYETEDSKVTYYGGTRAS